MENKQFAPQDRADPTPQEEWTFTKYSAGAGKAVIVLTAFEASVVERLLALRGEVAAPARAHQEEKDDEHRCAICGWTLADVPERGCVRGNCSQRPFPDRFYAPERANREYGSDVTRLQKWQPYTPPPINNSSAPLRHVQDALEGRPRGSVVGNHYEEPK